MKTLYKKIDAKNERQVIEQAAQIICDGGLVAFPTETVYGLGANALSPEASAKIYEAKGRPSDNPLIVHIAEIATIHSYVSNISDDAMMLMNIFWPGPLTLILQKKGIIPDSLTGGLKTVAVRMPEHPFALALIKKSGVPIAAPSANISGGPSPTTAKHVLGDLDGKIDMIADGGSTEHGLESTIIDVSTGNLRLLRPGAITVEMIEKVCGKIEIATEMSDKFSTPMAPGMKYKHYAPKADMLIVSGEACKVSAKIRQLVQTNEQNTAILTTNENLHEYNGLKNVFSMGSKAEIEEIGKNLFANLRHFDEIEVDLIYCEAVNEAGIGHAVMNRLKKAAAYHIINV